MSKKILKRSLALGALMAFVITGSAMAADITIETSDFSSVGSEWNTTGGFYHKTDKTDNIITAGSAGADFNSAIYGAYDTSGVTVNNNTVTLNGGKYLQVYGGYTVFKNGSVTANNNTININSAISGATIYGGYASTTPLQANDFIAEASNNKITVNCNGEVKNMLEAAHVINQYGKAVANNNSIEISSSATVNDLEVVRILGSSIEARGNNVTVNGIVNGDAYAVNAELKLKGQGSDKVIGNANVSGNSVTISGNGQTSGSVYAAKFDCGYDNNNFGINIVLSDNKVNIESASSVGNIYGAYVDTKILGANSTIQDNVVNITGDFTITGKKIYGAYVQNEVPLTGSGSYGAGSAVANASGNTVNIGGDVVIDNCTVYGGYVESVGETKAGVPDVSVDASTGKVTSTTKEEVANASNYTATATGNTVNIGGNAIVKGEVYGGYAKVFENENGASENTASNNTINISENADISKATLAGSKTDTYEPMTTIMNATMSGGSVDAGSVKTETEGGKDNDTSAQNTSNNTLNLSEDWTGGNGGKAISTVGNFDTIKIESADADNPIKIENLNLKEADESTGTKGTAVVVDKLQMESGTKEGESVKLFDVPEGNTKGDIDSENSKATVYVGTAEMGNASIGGEEGSSNINLTVQELDMNPQVLVIGESRAAATAFVNQGSELVETGLDALARDNAKAGDTKVFAAVYGNASEYATGSHVKVNGWSGIVGVGKTNDNGLTVGAFFENGDGNYRTYNVNAGTFMRGDGEAVYNGGGLLVRKDNANGVYTEASLRAGNLKNELKNAVMGKAGLDGYDVDTFYYGAHVGIGKVIPRGDEGDSIDIYGKFMYTHHDGETFNIQGDAYKFDSVDSERLRLGFRINEVQTSKLSMYYGAAWEYEFGGDADNKVIGYDLSTPSLGGSTMIGEIGMHYLASEKWSLDLNVRGYSGQRDGFTGSVQANYNF